MKVVATVKWAEARGGAERSVLDVTTGLQHRGHDVTVMYLAGGDLLPEYQRRGVEVRKAREFFLDRQRTLPSMIGLARTTLAGIRERPDLVYCQDYEHLTFGGAIAATTRSRLICHLRLVPPNYFAKQFQLAVTQVDRFIAVSDDVRTRFSHEAGLPLDRIDVVHNGIDLTTFSPGSAADRSAARARLGLADDDYAILFVGRIDRVKGIEVLIEAANRLGARHRNVRLLIVGQPIWHETAQEGVDYVEELNSLANDARIDFLGSQLDPVPFYRAADVVVVPSIWREPFGRVVIEAMACGKPVVASRIGGIPEILSGDLSELLFTPGDVDDLVARLERIHDDATDDLGSRLRAEAVARFGFDRVLDGITASIEMACAPRAKSKGGPR